MRRPPRVPEGRQAVRVEVDEAGGVWAEDEARALRIGLTRVEAAVLETLKRGGMQHEALAEAVGVPRVQLAQAVRTLMRIGLLDTPRAAAEVALGASVVWLAPWVGVGLSVAQEVKEELRARVAQAETLEGVIRGLVEPLRAALGREEARFEEGERFATREAFGFLEAQPEDEVERCFRGFSAVKEAWLGVEGEARDGMERVLSGGLAGGGGRALGAWRGWCEKIVTGWSFEGAAVEVLAEGIRRLLVGIALGKEPEAAEGWGERAALSPIRGLDSVVFWHDALVLVGAELPRPVPVALRELWE